MPPEPEPVACAGGLSHDSPAVLAVALEAYIAIAATGRVLAWNPAAEATFGFTHAEACGRPIDELIIPDRFRAAHRAGLGRLAAGGPGRVLGRRLTLDARHANGHEFPIEMTLTATEDAGGLMFHAFAHDVTTAQRAGRFADVESAVARGLAEADSSTTAAARVVEALGVKMGWPVVELWRVDDDRQLLTCAARHVAPGRQLRGFALDELDRGAGLPGRVCADAAAHWIADLSADTGSVRSRAAARNGLRVAVGVPLSTGAQTLGALCVYGDRVEDPEDTLIGLLGGLAAQVGQYLERSTPPSPSRRSPAAPSARSSSTWAAASTPASTSRATRPPTRRLPQDVLALTRELGVSVVRYPGGNFVSGYRWEDGVGPVATGRCGATSPGTASRPTRSASTSSCAGRGKAGVEPCTRSTSAPAACRRRWTSRSTEPPGRHPAVRPAPQHGADEPYGVRLWCLGNELDGPWQTGHKTADEYGRLAAETARAMRSADPGLELVACGSSNSAMPTFAAWEARCWSWRTTRRLHLGARVLRADDGDLGSFLASAVDMDHFIDSVVATADSVGARLKSRKKIKISFDEWNVWYHSALRGHPAETEWPVAPRVIEDCTTSPTRWWSATC
jgi:PAS domain S-box-containing protein